MKIQNVAKYSLILYHKPAAWRARWGTSWPPSRRRRQTRPCWPSSRETAAREIQTLLEKPGRPDGARFAGFEGVFGGFFRGEFRDFSPLPTRFVVGRVQIASK